MRINDYLEGKQPDYFIYKEVSGKGLYLQVQKPKGWSERDRRTAIVWIHGGGWERGTPDLFVPHCRYFAERGAVCFSVQYRLAERKADTEGNDEGSTIAHCFEDCKSAIRFIRKNAAMFGIDPERVVAGGDSAGGHLTMSLGTLEGFDSLSDDRAVSAVPDAVIDCNGIIDMTLKWKYMIPLENKIEMETEQSDAACWLARQRLAWELSPIYSIKKGQPPMLIMHGLKDTVVEPEDSYRFYEVYKAAGNSAELVLLPAAKHAFVLFNYSSTEEELVFIINTIDKYLVSLGFLDDKKRLKYI